MLRFTCLVAGPLASVLLMYDMLACRSGFPFITAQIVESEAQAQVRSVAIWTVCDVWYNTACATLTGAGGLV